MNSRRYYKVRSIIPVLDGIGCGSSGRRVSSCSGIGEFEGGKLISVCSDVTPTEFFSYTPLFSFNFGG
jgi:hypothetical protein